MWYFVIHLSSWRAPFLASERGCGRFSSLWIWHINHQLFLKAHAPTFLAYKIRRFAKYVPRRNARGLKCGFFSRRYYVWDCDQWGTHHHQLLMNLNVRLLTMGFGGNGRLNTDFWVIYRMYNLEKGISLYFLDVSYVRCFMRFVKHFLWMSISVLYSFP